MKYTASQKKVIQEVLAKLNQRRGERGRTNLNAGHLPELEGRNPSESYLVDTYVVRRHWRRKPRRYRKAQL